MAGNYVLPEDVQAVWPSVAEHRLAARQGGSVSAITQSLLQSVPVVAALTPCVSRHLCELLNERWLVRRLPSARRVVLNQKRIFIFPTGYGFFYLLVARAVVHRRHQLREQPDPGPVLSAGQPVHGGHPPHLSKPVRGWGLRNGDSESGFAGEEGALEVVLFSRRRDHHCIVLQWKGQDAQQVSVNGGEENQSLAEPASGCPGPGVLRHA